ncbi:MAG TPA: hypothetical protein VMY15_04825 [Candidatus Latescibacteria bacterium]|nr:hypothetical protein [Candidatus Latescibacterota bacterium]
MDIETNDPEFEEIARLIQEEEKAALEIFRRRDFRREVKARIGGSPTKSRPRVLLRRLPVPAGAAVLLLIAAWAFFFNPHPPVPNTGGDSGSFVAGVEGLPGLAELASRKGHPRPGDGESQGAPQSIRDVLALAQQVRTDEGENAPPGSGNLQVPRLSLEKKMMILFKDRVIERVLVLIRKKSEEA